MLLGKRLVGDRLIEMRNDTLLNPRVLIEVLSPSTESYDRGKKFAHYRTIESLAEYLLVAQDQMHVEQYTRQPSGDWLLHEVTDPADSITLTSIDCNLPLAQIYDRVEFDESGDQTPNEPK